MVRKDLGLVAMRILVIDGHPVIRAGSRSKLEARSDVTCVEEASNGDEVLSLPFRGRPMTLHF